MKTKTNFIKVTIKWLDSCHITQSWIDIDDCDFDDCDKSLVFESTGYFVRKTKVATYICLSRRVNKSGGVALNNIFAIPNKAILEITNIQGAGMR